MEDRPVTVVMLDNHDVVIDGVRGWCARARPPIRLIAAGTRFARVRTGEGAAAEVVVFDLGLQKEGVHEFHELSRLVREGRNVVVFSGEESPAVVLECARLGAKSFVTKAEGEEHLIHAIRAAAKGETYTTPKHAGMIVADPVPGRPALSEKQIEVLLAWCSGLSKPMVARKLHMSPSTVATHIERARGHYERVGRPAPDKLSMTNRLIQDDLLSPKEADPLADDP
ncbi:response regulator transcription factor [Streptomyces sp. G-G2]|uniref:response regulator transcription factor n=1 Tax=Streptomyces sp. G-G2 TaxID=3046201 RepID=UPI0024BB2E9E|nr:response regulator transcription factor [Streptomyces sp. G-G2]MDJ0382028.1 response regulator transcription factor [Streptomyces sp. G-G2]